MYFVKMLSLLRACTFTLNRRRRRIVHWLCLRFGRFEARLMTLLCSKVRTRHWSDRCRGDVLLQGATRGSWVERGWGRKNGLGVEKSLCGVRCQLLRFLVMMMVMLVMRGEMGLVVMLHRSSIVTQSVLWGLRDSMKYSYASTDASLSLQELLEGWTVLLWLVFILLTLSDTGTWHAHNHSSTNFPERLPFTWRASHNDASSF